MLLYGVSHNAEPWIESYLFPHEISTPYCKIKLMCVIPNQAVLVFCYLEKRHQMHSSRAFECDAKPPAVLGKSVG